MFHHRFRIAATIVALVLSSHHARACDDGMIRDAAFDRPRDVYRLCVFGNASDSASNEIFEQLEMWRASAAPHHNLEVVFVDTDSPDIDWAEYGVPSAPPETPAVALIGRIPAERKSFIVEHWIPRPSDDDLDVLRASSLRDQIRQQTATNLAVLVHAPGEDRVAGAARDAVEQVRADRERQGLSPISILTVDRTNAAERLLLAFANIPPGGDDWVCVVFGRGKFMTPLIGDEITEMAIADMLSAIEEDCTCSQSPSRLGVDILLAWDEEADASVVRLAKPKVSLASDSLDRDAPDAVELAAAESNGALGSVLMLSIGGLAILAVATAFGIVLRRTL